MEENKDLTHHTFTKKFFKNLLLLEKVKKNIKIIFVGDGACGAKTSFIRGYLRVNSHSEVYFPTVFENEFIEEDFCGHRFEILLADTAGQEDYDRLRPISYPDTDLVVIGFDISRPGSYSSVKNKWYPEIKEHLLKNSSSSNDPKIILVGAKSDLRTDKDALERLKLKDQKAISEQEGIALAKEIGANGYLELSNINLESHALMRKIIAYCIFNLNQKSKSFYTNTSQNVPEYFMPSYKALEFLLDHPNFINSQKQEECKQILAKNSNYGKDIKISVLNEAFTTKFHKPFFDVSFIPNLEKQTVKNKIGIINKELSKEIEFNEKNIIESIYLIQIVFEDIARKFMPPISSNENLYNPRLEQKLNSSILAQLLIAGRKIYEDCIIEIDSRKIMVDLELLKSKLQELYTVYQNAQKHKSKEDIYQGTNSAIVALTMLFKRTYKDRQKYLTENPELYSSYMHWFEMLILLKESVDQFNKQITLISNFSNDKDYIDLINKIKNFKCLMQQKLNIKSTEFNNVKTFLNGDLNTQIARIKNNSDYSEVAKKENIAMFEKNYLNRIHLMESEFIDESELNSEKNFSKSTSLIFRSPSKNLPKFFPEEVRSVSIPTTAQEDLENEKSESSSHSFV